MAFIDKIWNKTRKRKMAKIDVNRETVMEYLAKCVRQQYVVGAYFAIDGSTDFIHDLGGDYLDTVEFLMSVESLFSVGITDDESEGCNTVGDVAELLLKKNEIAPLKINESALD